MIEVLFALNSWWCTASGYDQYGSVRSVSGDYAPTQAQAEQSARYNCLSMGLMACQIKSCFGSLPVQPAPHVNEISK